MKVLDKITLVLFANIVVILAVIVCLLVFGWLEVDTVGDILTKGINDDVISKIILGVSVIAILLGINAIFFGGESKEDMTTKDGILLENEDGKLLVTKDTLENLVTTVINGFSNTHNVTSKVVLDQNNNLKVYVNMQVESNVIIKDLTANVQNKIKETIKTTTDLDVQSVNIRVKDITTKKDTAQS